MNHFQFPTDSNDHNLVIGCSKVAVFILIFIFINMLSDLNWDILETIRKKNRLTLMHKLSHNLVDINTEEHLIPNSELRTRNSHAFKYRMPKVSKDVFKFSFFPRSITEWNSLPADLVNCKSLSDFKLNLGKHVK